MRSARKLSLKKESLAELTPSDLGQVAGAATTTAVSNAINPCTLSLPAVCTVVSRIIRPCLTDIAC